MGQERYRPKITKNPYYILSEQYFEQYPLGEILPNFRYELIGKLILTRHLAESQKGHHPDTGTQLCDSFIDWIGNHPNVEKVIAPILDMACNHYSGTINPLVAIRYSDTLLEHRIPDPVNRRRIVGTIYAAYQHTFYPNPKGNLEFDPKIAETKDLKYWKQRLTQELPKDPRKRPLL